MWRKFLKAAIILIIAGVLQYFAFIVADAERGYDAVGSEYFVFPFTAVTGLYAVGFFRDEEEDDEQECGSWDYEETDLDVQYIDVF